MGQVRIPGRGSGQRLVHTELNTCQLLAAAASSPARYPTIITISTIHQSVTTILTSTILITTILTSSSSSGSATSSALSDPGQLKDSQRELDKRQ